MPTCRAVAVSEHINSKVSVFWQAGQIRTSGFLEKNQTPRVHVSYARAAMHALEESNDSNDHNNDFEYYLSLLQSGFALVVWWKQRAVSSRLSDGATPANW